MKQTVAIGMQSLKHEKPLLDQGMIALLAWLEERQSISLRRIHELCGRTEKFDTSVYKCEWPRPKRMLEIHRRKNAKGTIILGANYDHPDYKIGRTGIRINKAILPETLQLKLKDSDVVMKATDIIDHPYLTGAWTSRAEDRDAQIMITLNRAKARHRLTSDGMEAIR